MGGVGLNVYPSEDFDFVDSVQLPDLILDFDFNDLASQIPELVSAINVHKNI
jgi:hypothetical protein